MLVGLLGVTTAAAALAVYLGPTWGVGGGLLAVGLLLRNRGSDDTPVKARRLEVIARAGLSPKCAVGLIEVDGRRFLIAHGDGFAQLQSLDGSDAESVRAPSNGASEVGLALAPQRIA